MWDPWMSECTTFTWLPSYGYSVKCTRFIFHFEFFCLRIYHTLKEKGHLFLGKKKLVLKSWETVFTGSRGKEIYRDCKSAFEDQFVTRVYSITSDQTKIWIFLYQFHVFLLFLQWITPGFRLANTRKFFMIDKPRLDEMLVTYVLAGFERDMFTINKNGNSEKLLSIIWSPPASRNLNVF